MFLTRDRAVRAGDFKTLYGSPVVTRDRAGRRNGGREKVCVLSILNSPARFGLIKGGGSVCFFKFQEKEREKHSTGLKCFSEESVKESFLKFKRKIV